MTFLSKHRVFAAAAFIGLAVAAGCSLAGLVQVSLLAGVDSFFLLFNVLGLQEFSNLSHSGLKRWAGVEDEPPAALFVVTMLVAGIALLLLFDTVWRSNMVSPILMLSVAAVPLGWATVHLMAAFHYVRLYFHHGAKAKPGLPGLAFPGEAAPDARDFLYFAFTVGMTAQTSDVTVNAALIRRFVLLHAMLAFLFNTVLVAAVVNFAVAMKG